MTVGGVVVGTTAVILLIALTIGLQEAAEAGIGSSSILTPISVYEIWNEGGESAPRLTDDAIREFWRIPGVLVVVSTVRLQSFEMHSDDYIGFGDVMGIDPLLLPYLGFSAQEGTIALGPGQAIAGVNIAQNFYDPSNQGEWIQVSVDLINDPIEMTVSNYSTGATRKVDLEFSGIIAQTNDISDFVIYMPIDEVRSWNDWITGQEYDPETAVYDMVTVYTTDRKAVDSVGEAIRAMGYGTSGMGDYLGNLNSFFETMRLMLGAIGGVALLVAAFGVANTMMMAILERTREIGIMKAVGATNEAILTLFLLEAGLVGFLGGTAGVLLSKLLQNLVNTSIKNMTPGEGGMYFLPIDPTQIGSNLIVIPTELIAFAIVLATGVGIAAGIYPAWRAALMPPVLALKHE